MGLTLGSSQGHPRFLLRHSFSALCVHSSKPRVITASAASSVQSAPGAQHQGVKKRAGSRTLTSGESPHELPKRIWAPKPQLSGSSARAGPRGPPLLAPALVEPGPLLGLPLIPGTTDPTEPLLVRAARGLHSRTPIPAGRRLLTWLSGLLKSSVPEEKNPSTQAARRRPGLSAAVETSMGQKAHTCGGQPASGQHRVPRRAHL